MSAQSALSVRPTAAVPQILLYFAATLFVSAFLLFSVQPMFTKMVLPILGGAPSVWSVAMVFFQAVLLAGYLYAHILVRYFSVRMAALIHLALMGLALFALPVALPAVWPEPPAHGEALWLIGIFGVSVGLPFFAVSANGPLLQAWFSQSGHPAARDPYFLYGASNVGSFAALLAYPVAIEPFLSLKEQGRWWFWGFLLLGSLIALCASCVASQWGAGAKAAADEARPEALPMSRRLTWLGLAAVPSALLVAITAHISTDIAAAPLLWVVPLALFLLTFVIAFQDKEIIPGGILSQLLIWGTALVLLSIGQRFPFQIGLVLHLSVFFLGVLACHRALYRLRPGPARLTEFYLFMSMGGVLGGVACSLIAPVVLTRVVEYPILVVLALACGVVPDLRGLLQRLARPFSLALTIAGIAAVLIASVAGQIAQAACLAVFTIGIIVFWRNPARTVPMAALLALATLMQSSLGTDGRSYRSFFGVHRTAEYLGGQFRILMHGTTLHGAIRLRNPDGTLAEGRPEGVTYYTSDGGLARAVVGLRAEREGKLQSVAVVGLGAGVMACLSQPGERWSFFEIDPVIVQLASDPSQFRYLSTCTPGAPIHLGDARLKLAQDQERRSLIVLDAFSSDSIPVHLLTQEAIGLYLSKLDDRGVIAIHISNRHLELSGILARVAAEHGLSAYVTVDKRAEEPMERRLKTPQKVMLLARRDADIGALAQDSRWVRIEPNMARRAWTDDYSNLLEALLPDRWY